MTRKRGNEFCFGGMGIIMEARIRLTGHFLTVVQLIMLSAHIVTELLSFKETWDGKIDNYLKHNK